MAVALGGVCFAVTSALAIVTWQLASSHMIEQREQSAIRQSRVTAQLVDDALRGNAHGLRRLLSGLTGNPDSTILLLLPDRTVVSGRQIDPAALPPGLVALAHAGTPAKQRLAVSGVPVLALAVPLAAPDAVYVKLVSLRHLDRTIRFLSCLLTLGTVASALLGVMLGVWASRRALRPLTRLTAIASRIARGDLRARLPQQCDPDLKPLAATFNSTADALEQRVARDARFAGDVSHELRSPLTTMVNAAGVLRRRAGVLPSPAGQALELLTREVDRFSRMVVDLLEISRSDHQADLTVEPLALDELILQVLRRDSADGTEMLVDPGVPLVHADRRRLERVVGNLLDNAHRHGGGVERIHLSHRDGWVRLEVDDSGPGVPADLRERVFERFARGTHSGTRGTDTGSGLGLALVAEHTRRHGGEAWVEERPGGGARFVVLLPATPPSRR